MERGQKDTRVQAGGSERCPWLSPLASAKVASHMASEAIDVPMNAALFFTWKSKIAASGARGPEGIRSADFFAPKWHELFSR